MHAGTSESLGYADALECVASVYRALDASDGSALIRAFAFDAVWHRPDGDLSGWEQIEAMANSRDTSRTTAHVVGNLALEKTGDGWTARYYLTVYAGRDGLGQFVAILSCEDSIIATEDGPKVTSKRSKPLLRSGT